MILKRDDVRLNIRRMEVGDLAFAFRLTQNERWESSVDELARLIAYEPEGCFLAECDSLPVGMVTATCYGKLAWIGCLIVEPQWRRRGNGTILMRRAIEYLQAKGAETIRLDADEKAAPLYMRLGFEEECRSLRFRGVGSMYPGTDVRLLEPAGLEELVLFDARWFGADRSRVLRRLFRDFPGFCFASYAYGRLTGYVMARQVEGLVRIGPWVCRPDRTNPERAECLLQAILNKLAGQPVSLGVLEMNPFSVQILRRHGFQERLCSYRMRLGPDRHSGNPEGIFAIGAAAKG